MFDQMSRLPYRTFGSVWTHPKTWTRLRSVAQRRLVVLAAEHLLYGDNEGMSKRCDIVYTRRRSGQPVLAARDGHDSKHKRPLFRSGDILIRRGAASIRANSGM